MRVKNPQGLSGSFNVLSKIQTFLCAYEAVPTLSLTLKHGYTAVIYCMVSLEVVYEAHNVTNLFFRDKPEWEISKQTG